MTETVVVLGGYGVFGGYLCRALGRDPGWRVIVAGRNAAAARGFCAEHGGTPLALDRADPDLAERLAALAPFAVIDAAGPFQGYGDPVVARAALAAGAHYLDLSDDADFAAGISVLDATARAAGRVVLSGVSSVPALSSAAVASLAEGMEDIHLIDSAILPGNRAPRGLSVIQAILSQAGRPVAFWRGDRATSLPGWGDLTRVDLGPGLGRRWASVIGAPDLTLFPARFRARSVTFRAGLELPLMHLGLWLVALPVRAGLLRSLLPLSDPLKRVAEALHPFGTDRGGMRVRVTGLAGRIPVQRDWLLIAPEGRGPQVPAVPAELLLSRLRAGAVAPGARPALAEFPLAEAEALLVARGIGTSREERPFPLIFQTALGADFTRLPPALQDLHRVIDCRRWQGRASIDRGAGLLSRFVGWLMRFPKSAPDISVAVTMQRRGDAVQNATETWLRDFGGQRFRSVLRGGRNGRGVRERFGILSFDIALAVRGDRLAYPVTGGRVLGLPLPRVLLPVSETTEHVDERGRACFDVALSHPLTGPIVRYRGWLEPAPRGDDAPINP
ncbi:MAG: DUF4166 domain-containing protein [Paracoccaceae bacterium]